MLLFIHFETYSNTLIFLSKFFLPPISDDCEPQGPTGYDFGNDEDNEDEDVRRAYERFLGGLP